MNGYLEALAHWMDGILERRRMGEGMKATAKYVINVELKGDDEETILHDSQLFAKHLHLMLDLYAQIGTVNIDRYWMGDDDPQKEEEEIE